MEQAEILIRLRKEKGLSQAEVAEELGVTRQAVSRWESGRAWPSAEKLIALSKVYGVAVEELIRTGAEREPAAEPEKTTPETEEAMREPGKKEKRGIPCQMIWRIAAAACFCGGVLLWGKVTNSTLLAAGFLVLAIFVAVLVCLLYGLFTIITHFRRMDKK